MVGTRKVIRRFVPYSVRWSAYAMRASQSSRKSSMLRKVARIPDSGSNWALNRSSSPSLLRE